MTRTPTTGGGVVALVLLVVGLALLGLRAGTGTTAVEDDPPRQPPADGSAVVHGLHAPGGWSLFGIQLIDPTHSVEVQFLTGPGCAALLDSGEPWPAPYPECGGDGDVTGTVGSLGVTASGRSLVGVTFTVPGDCYDRLRRGMPWPPGIPQCAG